MTFGKISLTKWATGCFVNMTWGFMVSVGIEIWTKTRHWAANTQAHQKMESYRHKTRKMTTLILALIWRWLRYDTLSCVYRFVFASSGRYGSVVVRKGGSSCKGSTQLICECIRKKILSWMSLASLNHQWGTSDDSTKILHKMTSPLLACGGFLTFEGTNEIISAPTRICRKICESFLLESVLPKATYLAECVGLFYLLHYGHTRSGCCSWQLLGARSETGAALPRGDARPRARCSARQ